ncbi:hypothetical protein Q9L58_010204 [Maublancomyces gigas]|uniref:Uncharacterized protein n=1 Tax=Discina gigas TaxID=1032678 RepID=A0ABR3G4V8_9PEZI
MAIAEASYSLGRFVKANVGSAFEASPEEEETIQDYGGLWASGDEEYHKGTLFPLALAFFRQLSGGAVEGDAWVELFHLALYLAEACSGGGYGGGDVVDNDLYYLDLFLEASGRGDKVANGGLKLCFGHDMVV